VAARAARVSTWYLIGAESSALRGGVLAISTPEKAQENSVKPYSGSLYRVVSYVQPPVPGQVLAITFTHILESSVLTAQIPGLIALPVADPCTTLQWRRTVSRKLVVSLLPALLMVTALANDAQADVQYGVGFLTVDIPATTGAPNSYELDVVNLTALNNSVGGALTGNPSVDLFPIGTQLLTDVSSLTVTAADGTTTMATLGPAYFSLDADGQSLSGGALTLNTASSSTTPGSVTFTGTFSTTHIELDNGSFVNILPTFSVKLTDPTGVLMNGDSVEIFASTTAVIPEPSFRLLLGAGLVALVCFKVRQRFRFATARLLGAALLGVLCFSFLPSVRAAVTGPRLSTWTNPSSGVAGTTTVYVSGTNFPSGLTTSNVTLSFASTCYGPAIATASPTSVTVLVPTVDRIGVLIPKALSLTGDYFISLSAAGLPSVNCSELTVTVPISVSGACLPSSSIGIGIIPTGPGGTVTAYVPNGAWDHGPTGLQVVPLEPSGTPVSVPTPNTVNACSSSHTGQSVCTANNTDVYVLSGSTITNTLTSGSDSTDSFSGGSCHNCGVAINPNTNQAVISMGLSGFAGGYQFLNLGATPSFVGAPIGVAHEPTENIVWDATRDLILSPNEAANYDVIQVGKGATSIAEFSASIPNPDGGDPDSAGEDCTTGIAMSTVEFTDTLFFTDLTQAVFTPGSPAGTWSAPGQTLSFPEFDGLGAGTSGMAVAPGSHLAVIAGEFGRNSFGVVQLPATSGHGTPAPVDYVQAYLPTEPNGCSFEAGWDPHTVSAYTSPNTGKIFAVMADGDGVAPGYLALVDMPALLAATRTTGTHSVSPSVNLLTTGIVTYVSTGNTVAPCDSPAERSGARPAVERPANALAPTPLNHR
jgi:hypothetical protein